MQAALHNGHSNKVFKIRLMQAEGGTHTVSVVVDHFRFMGKKLSVVKLAEPDQDNP